MRDGSNTIPIGGIIMKNQTIAEYLDNPQPVAWLHCLDVLEHVMKGDTKNSVFRNPYPSKEFLPELREELAKHKDVELPTEYPETWQPLSKKWKNKTDVSGDLDIELYLDRDKKEKHPKCFQNAYRTTKKKPALNILFEFNVPYSQRKDNYMKLRHKEIYALAYQCEQEGRPCRVLAALSMKLNSGEFKEKKNQFTMFMIVKDYHEPIFPGIWGGLKTNSTSNSLINCISDYLLGTYHDGNGSHHDVNIGEYFEGEDIALIQPKYLSV
jgi:hypothetical protein